MSIQASRLLLAAALLGSLAARGQQGPLRFDSTAVNAAVRFVYPSAGTDAYLGQLRTQELSRLADAGPDELQRLLAVVDWTHALWKHSGGNEPSKPDALTIIREARAGKKFRCVEYAQVSTDALLALGLPARTLALKTRDAETRKSGAGHVLTEVWLPSRRKWAVADAQFNLVPFLNDVPLNAVELQRALASRQPVGFRNAAGPVPAQRARQYTRFVTRYLYYFDVPFDQRQVPARQKASVGPYSALMLGPVGARQPVTFQRRFPLDYVLYTTSLRDFYRAPESAE